MTGVVADSLLVSVVGGLMGLDRAAAFQTMVSRPLVTATVVGWLLGSLPAGLSCGVVVELLLSGDLPVGAHVPMHETSVAAAAAAVTSALAGPAAAPLDGAGALAGEAERAVPLALVAVLPAALVYHRADAWARSYNARFFRNAGRVLEGGGWASMDAPARENLKGLGPFFLASAASLFVTVLPLTLAAGAVSSALGGMGRPLVPASAGVMVLALAAGARAVRNDNRGLVVFAASALAAAVLMVWAGWAPGVPGVIGGAG